MPSLREARVELDRLSDHDRHKRKAQILAELARGALFASVKVKPGGTGSNKYERVAETLYRSFVRTSGAEFFEGGGVHHGFNVAARLTKWGMRAYAQSCQESDRQTSAKDLGAILEGSYDPLVTTFSGLSADINQVMERVFGLLSHEMPAYEELPYVMIKDPSTEAGFKIIPSPVSLQVVNTEILPSVQRYYGQPGPSIRCPAQGIMLKTIWDATIRACVENDQLFPADLRALAEAQSEIAVT